MQQYGSTKVRFHNSSPLRLHETSSKKAPLGFSYTRDLVSWKICSAIYNCEGVWNEAPKCHIRTAQKAKSYVWTDKETKLLLKVLAVYEEINVLPQARCYLPRLRIQTSIIVSWLLSSISIVVSTFHRASESEAHCPRATSSKGPHNTQCFKVWGAYQPISDLNSKKFSRWIFRVQIRRSLVSRTPKSTFVEPYSCKRGLSQSEYYYCLSEERTA